MKKLTTLLLLTCASLNGFAQRWVDVTDQYVVNPRFDNDDRETGWEGTSFGAANPRENAEHYNKTYDTYQTIKGLKAGKYRVYLNAFYRMGSADNDYSLYSSGDYNSSQHAQLYATSSVDEQQVDIVPASSAACTKSLGGGVSEVNYNRLYIPNNMEAADYWFKAGYYINSVECEVGTDGILTIGIRKSETIESDWTCIDNWSLERYVPEDEENTQTTWIDITDAYIVNPRYDNNDRTTGWEGWPEFGAANPMENAEHYQNYFDNYQTITGLTPGQYRLSLDAFYRIGSASNDYQLYTSGSYTDYQYAKLYANSAIGNYETAIAPISSAALEESLGGAVSRVGSNRLCVPNNMEAAHYWFEAGYYDNSLECEVGEDGVLTIGIYKYDLIWEDWVCLDNWKLEIMGELVNVSSIQLSINSFEIVSGETIHISADVLPANATFHNVRWSSSDERIATVDDKGNVTAISIGTCNIIATALDGSGVEAKCKVIVANNPATAQNLVINEIMAANVDVYLDSSQNYGSWVEIYNPSDKSVSLGGLYVSDDPKNLKKHRLIDTYGAVPSQGFALLNFDHFEVWTPASYRQIDDKLDCDGGTIIISDGTKIIVQQDYPEAIARISYARTSDGGNEWGFTSLPSPGYSNQMNSNGWGTQQLPPPVVDKDGQLYTGSMQVCVNIPEGATLRYTTDGTTPTLTNGETSETGLFTVTYNSESWNNNYYFRFRLFKDGYLPSKVVTRTYIYDEGNYHFPIISLVTDYDNIYDEDFGVFEQGPYGRPGNGQSSKCNWNMDWDRPVSFEYITEDNECLVSQECDFSMCGGWSRAWTPHAFKLKAKKTYDFENTFKTQFFSEKPFLKSKTLQIRNGGNDTSCRIKDPAIQQIVARSGLNVDYQEWQPVHVFLNGWHYAVLNMREPNNKDYAYANYGIDSDEMDQFEISPDSGYVQMRGTDESFLRLVELSENAADKDTYEEICKLLDIDEYANYMAVELYTGNWDWPQNNVKGFRDVNDGKFRFVLFDLDGALSTNTPFSTFFGKQTYTFDTLHGFDYSTGQSVEGQHNRKEIKFVTLFKNLLQNEAFCKKFIDTYCIVGGSIFQPEKVKSIVSEMRDYLNTGGWVNSSGTANDLINKFSTSYNNTLTTHLKNTSAMNLKEVTKQAATFSANVAGAKIKMNGIDVPYTNFDGYIFAPITLKAEAPAGYQFKGWTSTGSTTAKSVFETGTSWRYYDKGSLDGTNWYESSYSATGWSTGKTSIGYGKDQTTETAKNLPCYYFRKTFALTTEPRETDDFVIDFTIDDGMVLYVNGVEAGRYNMPSGDVNYNTLASSYAPNNPDTGSLTLKGSLFKRGTNVIAVEVHNNDLTSTDILWDASLTLMAQNAEDMEYVSTDTEYTLPSSGTQKLVAVFEAISAEDMIAEGITPVRVNEIGAANSMYVNDYFKKNDWVELYNTTDKDIDIAGMYVSDNVKKPEKYQVPTDDALLNTIIPAHGYKVLWCDKLDNIGTDIHTSFKLEADGGDVVITTSAYADTLHYDAHTGIQSFGRYPDGGNDTYVMNLPTLAKANQIGSYDTLYVAPEEVPEPDAIRTYTKEGGITIACVDGTINVKSEDAPISRVAIFSTSGMKMPVTPIMRAGNQFAAVNVTTLPRGIYIAVATTASGDECRIKFMIQ